MTEKDEKDKPQENSAASDDDLDSLSEDEKAAFEKILAEINAGEHQQETEAEADQPSQPADADNPDDQLSDDQQAALDKIMAEINSGDQNQEPEAGGDEPASAEADNTDDQLSDDQQAALDKIMAEINSRDQNQEPEAGGDEPASAEADNPDDKLSDDQQAALDKIMAEINSRDQDQPEDTGAEQEPTQPEESKTAQETQSNNSMLSLDEFNEELDSLLSEAQVSQTKTAPKSSSSKEMDDASKPKPQKATAVQPPETPALKYGPAPQPSAPSTASPDDDPTDDATGTQTDSMEKSQPAYAVLQEIDPDQERRTGSSRKARPKRHPKAGVGRLFKLTAAAALVLSTAGLIYWGMPLLNHRTRQSQVSITKPLFQESSSESSEPPMTADLQPTPGAQPQPADNATQPPQARTPAVTPLGSLKSDLAAARKKVGDKIEEIINLIAYYKDGIQEEHLKIRTVLKDNAVPSLEKAIGDSKIELSIRAIQRRQAYIAKLDTPLEQLKASSEELLFLERRTQIFETLSQWVSGPSMPQYKQEIADRIQTHLKIVKGLSVSNVLADLPSKASVWEEVLAELKKENALAAQRSQAYAQDKRIGQEICNGDYGRKYLLAHLTEETATCLIQWSGKDLYLNGLSELSPQAARILAQWPGEWISLNGIKEISTETARCLAQWPGKRLSLNGLERLSAQATAELSKWKGEQLEMIGLSAIGPWENYATRLYLSENMRRKLQM